MLQHFRFSLVAELAGEFFDADIAAATRAPHPPTPRFPPSYGGDDGDRGSVFLDGLIEGASEGEDLTTTAATNRAANESKSGLENGSHGDTTERQSISDMMEELTRVRLASARVDEQLKRISESGSPTPAPATGATTASTTSATAATGAQAAPQQAKAAPAAEPPATSAEDDELAMLRAQLAAVRAQSAMMEKALGASSSSSSSDSQGKQKESQPPAKSSVKTAAPATATLEVEVEERHASAQLSAGSGSPKPPSRKPSRHAPPPPLAPPAVLQLLDDDEDCEIMPLADLASREIVAPRPALKPTSPRDEDTMFPPSVWLGCVLDIHAVIAANEVWGLTTNDSSDDDGDDDDDDGDNDSLIALAMSHITREESSLDVERRRGVGAATATDEANSGYAEVVGSGSADSVTDTEGYVAVEYATAVRKESIT
jgi:hypothetical protein